MFVVQIKDLYNVRWETMQTKSENPPGAEAHQSTNLVKRRVDAVQEVRDK